MVFQFYIFSSKCLILLYKFSYIKFSWRPKWDGLILEHQLLLRRLQHLQDVEKCRHWLHSSKIDYPQSNSIFGNQRKFLIIFMLILVLRGGYLHKMKQVFRYLLTVRNVRKLHPFY